MKNKTRVQSVVLCGGSGMRLWPLSFSGFPKQFLRLSGARSLFQQAAERLMGLGVEGVEVVDPVACGDKKLLITESHSTYIPLENIEVQSGGYLGEDDIVRFEDHYKRS